MRGLQARLGLYVITSQNAAAGRSHTDIATAACAAGADAVQLRAPELAEDETAELARDIAAICRQHGTLFIVNDSVELARSSGADGVHLGQLDDPWGGRERLGPGPALGISVVDLEQAPGPSDAEPTTWRSRFGPRRRSQRPKRWDWKGWHLSLPAPHCRSSG